MYSSLSSPSFQENLNYEDNNRADLKDAGNNQDNLNYGALIQSNREHQEEGALETTLNQEEMTLPSDQVEQERIELESKFTYKAKKVGTNILRGKYKTGRWVFLGWEWSARKSYGSLNVTIVREDQIDTGTIAHELGHTLGQYKEFYNLKRDDGFNYDCRDFRHDTLVKCLKYEIGKSLRFYNNENLFNLEDRTLSSSNKQNIGIRKGLFSIMHSGFYPIEEKWIDRDTYQKAFTSLLSDKSREELLSKTKGQSSGKSPYLNMKNAEGIPTVIISGIYIKDPNNPIGSFHEDPKMEIYKDGSLITPSFKDGDIQFDLLDSKEITAHKIRVSSFAEIEYLTDTGGETHELSAIPIVVALPLRKGISEKDYKVIIRKIDKNINEPIKPALFQGAVKNTE